MLDITKITFSYKHFLCTIACLSTKYYVVVFVKKAKKIFNFYCGYGLQICATLCLAISIDNKCLQSVMHVCVLLKSYHSI